MIFLFGWLALEANSLWETLARCRGHLVPHQAAISPHHRRSAVGASNATCRRDGRQGLFCNFPGQAVKPGFSLSIAPSGRGGLGEMVGCAPQLSTIEVMRKSNKTNGFSYILSRPHENINKTQCFSTFVLHNSPPRPISQPVSQLGRKPASKLDRQTANS